MSLRDALNQRPAVTTGLVLLLLLAAAGVSYVVLGSTGGPQHEVPTHAWFLDEKSDDPPFTAPLSEEPPLTPPGKSEPTGIRLHVYACGSCEDETKHFRGFVETSTPEAKQARIDMIKLENGELQGGGIAKGGGMPVLQAMITKGEKVALPEKPYKWELKSSAAGQKILVAHMTKCGSEGFKECFPPN